MKIITLFYLSITLLFSQSFYIQGDKKVYLQKITQKNHSKLTPYKTSENSIIFLDNKLFIRFNHNITSINEILVKYNISLEKQLSYNYILVSAKSTDEALLTLEKMTNDKNILYIAPNFYKQPNSR